MLLLPLMFTYFKLPSVNRGLGVAVVAESSSIAVDDELHLRNIAILAANIKEVVEM